MESHKYQPVLAKCSDSVIGVALNTQLRSCIIKNSYIQGGGGSLNVVKLIFHTIRNCT